VKNSLLERRREAGWSQARLAELVGVTRLTVISIEKGRFDPSLPLAFRLAALFGVRIEDLFSPQPDPVVDRGIAPDAATYAAPDAGPDAGPDTGPDSRPASVVGPR